MPQYRKMRAQIGSKKKVVLITESWDNITLSLFCVHIHVSAK
jgi:hypothetical protein